ncbi:hypothetical protein [Pelotalea chapellei]|uniref:FG-GAP repeat protein n=1 Tax=Pelotalea chapellei TaxID=44671 RepID=A0ABS5U598_9BACT|nr:hypothetical protein [Pelotalea chapellei]MBT1070829.1 hypothetical protein [Pelotalea chapellei]
MEKAYKVLSTIFVFILLLFALPVLAEEDIYIPMNKLPHEVRPFVTKGMKALSFVSADLNGDGFKDFILVLERQKSNHADIVDRQRPFLLLIRQSDKKLKECKRNDRIVYCSTCGGMMGDPFQEVRAGKKTFTVSQSGGSAWRWSVDYTFNYSRLDKTWQLVRVKEESFHASDPDNGKTEVFIPNKDYGKIDIADFNPEKWKGQGQK